MQCEIFETLLDEARNSYPQEIVHELQSSTVEDMQSNVQRIEQWYKNFMQSQ